MSRSTSCRHGTTTEVPRQRHALTEEGRSGRRRPPAARSPIAKPKATSPPGALLVALAQALDVSADELRGLKAATEKTPPKTARLRKRLQLVEQLRAADQRTILKLVETFAEARRSARPRAKARVAS